MTFRMGEKQTEIDFVFIKKQHQWPIQNVKVNPGEFQHSLMVAEIDTKIKNVIRKTCTERRKLNLLKDLNNRKRYEEK